MSEKGDDRMASADEPPAKRVKTGKHPSADRHDVDQDAPTDDTQGLRDPQWKGASQPSADPSKRESVLVMRLATKEQEIQELLPQIHELKASQLPSMQQLRSALLDPAVNLLFQRLTTELNETKEKLRQAQDDMNAWKFTPDSVTGRKLMAKCRSLIQENQDLGKQLSQGRIAQLEAELALQKTYTQELKTSQDEMQSFVLQLDEELEGMHATIMVLQDQLKSTKQQLADAEERIQQYGGSSSTTAQTTAGGTGVDTADTRHHHPAAAAPAAAVASVSDDRSGDGRTAVDVDMHDDDEDEPVARAAAGVGAGAAIAPADADSSDSENRPGPVDNENDEGLGEEEDDEGLGEEEHDDVVDAVADVAGVRHDNVMAAVEEAQQQAQVAAQAHVDKFQEEEEEEDDDDGDDEYDDDDDDDEYDDDDNNNDDDDDAIEVYDDTSQTEEEESIEEGVDASAAQSHSHQPSDGSNGSDVDEESAGYDEDPAHEHNEDSFSGSEEEDGSDASSNT